MSGEISTVTRKSPDSNQLTSGVGNMRASGLLSPTVGLGVLPRLLEWFSSAVHAATTEFVCASFVTSSFENNKGETQFPASERYMLAGFPGVGDST